MQPVQQKIAKRVFKWLRPTDPFGPWKGGDRHSINCYGLAWNARTKRWYIWVKRGSGPLRDLIAYYPDATRIFISVRADNKEMVWLKPGPSQAVVISNYDKGAVKIKHPALLERWAPLEAFTWDDLRVHSGQFVEVAL